MLLLQELQQEKTHQQLLSPLPFPTSLPLLAASVASSKTVISDPIRYLQCLTQDMLHAVSIIYCEICFTSFDLINFASVGRNDSSTHKPKSTFGSKRSGYRLIGLHLPIIM